MSLSAWLNAAAARALVLEEGVPRTGGWCSQSLQLSWRRAGGEAPSFRCPDCSASPDLLKIDHQAGKFSSSRLQPGGITQVAELMYDAIFSRNGSG
jgi:hypothetical protein